MSFSTEKNSGSIAELTHDSPLCIVRPLKTGFNWKQEGKVEIMAVCVGYPAMTAKYMSESRAKGLGHKTSRWLLSSQRVRMKG